MQSKDATAGGDVQHLERGTVVLEDPDVASWHFNPPAPALEKLITLIVEAFGRTGGDWGVFGFKHGLVDFRYGRRPSAASMIRSR